MINTSNEYKKHITSQDNLPRNFKARAAITLADSTTLETTEEDIIVKGFKIDDSVSANNSFQIGAAIINQFTLMLNNIEGKFNDYDFTDAVIRPYIGLKLSTTTEWLAKGVFTVDESKVASSIVSLICLDNMYKFDMPFSDVEIDFPCTNLQLLQKVCLHCGVSLATLHFLNGDFLIERRPNDEAINCREIVSWIAQMAGCFARINTQGSLELKWYDFEAFENESNIDGGIFDEATPYATGDNADGGNFIDYNSGDDIDGGTFLDTKRFHHLYAISQADISTDDIVITGVQVKAQGTKEDYGETILFGSTGYVIEMTNPLIQENTAHIIANSVGQKIVGMRFRPLNISTLSDPSIEAGDVAKVSDRKGNVYHIMVTNLSYTVGENEKVSCDAETPSRKRSVRYDEQTKAIIDARKEAQKQITAYDLAVQQLNDLVLHSFGVYKSEETLPDGSKIFYSHDKPTLAESQNVWKQTANTFTVSNDGGQTWRGMDADGNMVATVLNAIGVNAEWINVLTSFNVGENFSVDRFGILKATDAEISGKIMADNGKIGPFEIDDNGIFSDAVKLYVWDMIAGLELNKKGENNGTVEDGDNGAEEAAYKTGNIVFDTVADGIKTHFEIFSSSTEVYPRLPHISVRTMNASTDEMMEYMEISPANGITIEKYDNGDFEKKITLSPDDGIDMVNADGDRNYLNEGQLVLEYNGNDAFIALGDNGLDIIAGEIFISANKVTISGERFTEM